MAKVLFYGRLAEAMGRERVIALPPNVATVGALLRFLASEDSDFRNASLRTQVRVAVNDEMAGEDTAIGDADEIALMPPFSGG